MFITYFKQTGLSAELWIDGSFLTEKPEPNDIDIVFLVNQSDIQNAPVEAQRLLDKIFNQREGIKLRYKCDHYIVYPNDEDQKSYWLKHFGQNGKLPNKGIASIKIA